MDKKISQLTVATSVSITDVVPIVQGTVTKKITPVVLFGNIPTNVNYAGVLVESGTPDTIQSGAASISTAITYLSNITTGLTTVTLPDGIQGQEKTILCTVRDSHDIELVPTNFANGLRITFGAVGHTCKLKFMNSEWCVLSLYGATIS
jgi:hypothetical protein